MAGILTMTQLVQLETIAGAAQRTAKVARATDDGEVLYGIARSIGDERGMFLGHDTDIRDGYLRVTSRAGFEHFWPVAELMREVSDGLFAEYDWT